MASTARVTRVRINHAEARRLLRGDGRYRRVATDLAARADRVAEAAGRGMVAHLDEYASRARGVVVTATAEAMLAEATHHALVRSVDAAR